MSRAGSAYKAEAQNDSLKPILLLRVLDIPAVNNPSVKVSLYLTDANYDVSFFNEEDNVQLYTACGLSYNAVNATTENEIATVTIRIDNVSGVFTSLAKDYVVKNARVHLLEVFEDTLVSVAGARWLFQGHIDYATLAINTIEVSVTADFSLAVRVPRRLYWVKDFPHLPSAKDPRTLALK